MKRLLLAFLLAVAPLWVSAQEPVFTLHGHPQKAAYASEAEWPTVDTQCHWLPQNTPPDPTTSLLGHVHLALTAPLYAEVGGPVTVPFTLKLFQLAGAIQSIGGATVDNIVFDGPATVTSFDPATGAMATLSTVPGSGTSTPTIAHGDPSPWHLIVETGHLTIDPAQAAGTPNAWPAKGWAEAGPRLVVHFDNSNDLWMMTGWSFYSVLDPAAPQTGYDDDQQSVVSQCLTYPVSGKSIGAAITSVDSYLPLAPISQPYPLSIHSYGYDVSATNELQPGLSEISLMPTCI